MVKRYDKCNESCSTQNVSSNKICTLNKTEDVNGKMFSMIRRKTESNLLTEHISCDCKCRFDTKKCNLNLIWNNDQCRCQCKRPLKEYLCKKYCICNPNKCACERDIHSNNYTINIANNLILTYKDEYDDETLNDTKRTIKPSSSFKNLYNLYFLLLLLSIIIIVCITVE